MKGENRKSLIQKIHIGKSQLGFDDDTYRDFLALHGNDKSSCTQMSVPELYAVFNAMKAAGFKTRYKGKAKPYATQAKQPLMNKIEALLADSGKTWAYAEGIAKRMYGKQRLQWCNAEQLRAVVVALVKQQRQGK